MTTTLPAGWKPIESAPKDGTDILLTNGVHVSCGHWHYDEGGTTEYRDLDGRYIGQDDRDGFAGWLDWMGGMTPNPTHWMPLPAAPGTPPATTQDDTLARTGNTADHQDGWFAGVDHGRAEARAGAKGDVKDEQPQKNGCGSVSFELSDGSTVSCDWSANEWELTIPAKRSDRDTAFKELLQEIGRLRSVIAAPAAGDARDAERYRWLREKSVVSMGYASFGLLSTHTRDSDFFSREEGIQALDAAIDAAIAAQQGKGGEA